MSIRSPMSRSDARVLRHLVAHWPAGVHPDDGVIGRAMDLDRSCVCIALDRLLHRGYVRYWPLFEVTWRGLEAARQPLPKSRRNGGAG